MNSIDSEFELDTRAIENNEDRAVPDTTVHGCNQGPADDDTAPTPRITSQNGCRFTRADDTDTVDLAGNEQQGEQVEE